jgi:hypothetical protein
MANITDTKSKIFGQAKPAAVTLTDLCTIAVNKEAHGTVRAANQSATADKVRIAHLPSGDTLADRHYVVYDVEVPGGGALDDDFDLDAGGVIKVYSTNGTTAFIAEGMEVSK